MIILQYCCLPCSLLVQSCKCDVHCEEHGDCCIDYAYYCNIAPDNNNSSVPQMSVFNTMRSEDYKDIIMSWGSLAKYETCMAPMPHCK